MGFKVMQAVPENKLLIFWPGEWDVNMGQFEMRNITSVNTCVHSHLLTNDISACEIVWILQCLEAIYYFGVNAWLTFDHKTL